MRSSQNMQMINEGPAANVHRLFGILLQNGHLPRVLSELTVTIDVHWVLDATGDAVGVASSALSGIADWRLLEGSLRSSAADLIGRATLLRSLLLLLIVGLTLYMK